MDDQIYLPSEKDKEVLRRILDMADKNIGRKPHDEQDEVNAPDDFFVAVPPCGEGIPARSGTVPGVNDCCIFKLVLKSGTDSAVANLLYELVPVNQPRTGQPVRQTVYNIYDQAIPALLPPNEKYIHIKKDKFGKWLALPPSLFSSTPTTTTPASGIVAQTCVGNCKWVWNGTCWTSSGCTTSSTTSTTTTTSSTTSTTTTTAACLCAGTTSTTTSTTTTGCAFCSYPPFCGTSVGQCYFSSCAKIDPVQFSSCSCTTSTTPSCNCNTTSTNGPCLNPPCGGQGDNCGGNCVWHYDGKKWNLAYQGCATCSAPPSGANTCGAYVEYCGVFGDGGVCGTITDVGCFATGGGGGSGGPCSNSPYPPKCCWCYWTAINDWILDSGGCCAGGLQLGPLQCHFDDFGNASCTGGWGCPKPSFIPNMGSSTCNSGCSLPFTTDLVPYCSLYPSASCVCNCSNGTGPTTTSVAPGSTTTTATPGSNACTCGYCYTTTTIAPISAGYCLWQCSSAGGAWSSISNNCSGGYSCSAPPEVCLGSCHTQISACTSTTTTT